MQSGVPSTAHPFLTGGGQAAQLIAAFDWSRTSIGAIDSWPASMKGAIALMLRSAVPIVMLWGEDGVMIYNDGYSVFAGGRHPQLLGSAVREGWPEVADFNDNVMRVGLAGGTLSYQDQELTLNRTGRAEQVWMNLDYSPLLDDSGKPAGVIAIVIETTAKVRAVRRVQSERERLGQMFEQAPGFMGMTRGPTHLIDMANEAYLQLVGRRDVIGKPLSEALPELAEQEFIEVLDSVYSTGEPFFANAMPFDLQRWPGRPREKRYLDLVLQPLRDEDGRITGIFTQGTDVTDRVVAQEAVRMRDARFRTFAQAMPNHVWSSPPNGQLDWFNDKVSEYSGRAQEQLLGSGWAAMVHPDDVPLAVQRWTQARETGQTYEVEFRLRRVDGAYRWHLARAVPLRDETNTIVHWIGTNTDIEDQKAAAQSLARMNQTLEQQVAERTADRDRMWRLSKDVMLVADFEAKIVSVNPALTTLLGWSQTELLGQNFIELVHPDDRSATLAEVAGLSGGATTFRFENRYRRKDGSYCLLMWSAVPDENFIHAVGRDMTADREAEDALKRTQAALYQAQKMESVGQLTGGVAHDFNNLLQVISGNLQLLSRTVTGNERVERYVANALAGTQRGAKLANQLLAFARRQPLEPKVVNIAHVVTGMEEMLRSTIGDAVEIETVVSGGLWNSFVDPAQVENALLNLALNARDAMAGSGRLTIEAGNASLDEFYVRDHPELSAGQYVMLAVTDTGSGMPPEVLARVFEPFFSTKAEGKGTGLGLSMVYGFVKQSGGHVKLYSEQGHGTTVKIYLPRADAGETQVMPVDIDGLDGGNETILVAEDDDAVRATVVELLGQLGYTVLEARDAASALAIIERGAQVDLLFTDVVMPGPLRSPELARRAKEILPNIAVLFTSGYTQNAIVHGGRLDAGVELLGKPYAHDALAKRIRRVLALTKMGAAQQ